MNPKEYSITYVAYINYGGRMCDRDIMSGS